VEEFPGKEDVLRYVLTANMPETKDSEFTWKDYQDKNNNVLVAILGNFVNRVLVLQQKYFEGKVQELDIEKLANNNRVENLDLEWGENGFAKDISDKLEHFRFREAASGMIDIARAANKYLTDEEPWKHYKENPDKAAEVLHVCTQVIANLAIAINPVMPFTSEKLMNWLHMKGDEIKWQNLGNYKLIPAGRQLEKPSLLFEKVEDETVEQQKDKLKKARAEAMQTKSDYPEIREEISFEDFMKPDIRVGTIVKAETMKNADKLLKLTVDIGVETRTIVSGIAQHFRLNQLPGQQVCVVANLAPKELMGVESNGMILMAEEDDGSLKFVETDAATGSPIM
jgi:methionyl-tRNA synthetase